MKGDVLSSTLGFEKVPFLGVEEEGSGVQSVCVNWNFGPSSQ